MQKRHGQIYTLKPFLCLERILRVGLALSVALAGCVRNPVSNRREARLLSEEAERKIGRETRDQIVEEYGELEDPVLREYVSSVGKKIAALSDRPRLDYEFLVLKTDMINAFAAPGGFIFVTRGLLEDLQNEAELAVVLGHEIGHVCAAHSVKMIQKQMGYGTLATLGAIVSGLRLGPEAMLMVAQTANLFTSLYLLGYSREYELEADRVGFRYAVSAGYNPRAALAFFQRLNALEKREGGEEWQTYLRSHPPTESRVALAKKALGRMDLSRRALTSGERVYLDMKNRLPRPDAKEIGRTQGPFYINHNYGFSLRIPSNWEWDDRRGDVLVAFRAKAGDGWGDIRVQSLKESQDARDLARKFVADRRWQFVGGRDVLYPAGYGYLAHFDGTGLLGGIYRYRGLFLVQDKTAYILLCAASPDKLPESMVSFEQILRSFVLFPPESSPANPLP